MLDDVEPQPGAFGVPHGRRHPLEGLEELGRILGAHPDAVVADVDDDLLALQAGVDRGMAVRAVVLAGIAQQVDDDLTQALGVDLSVQGCFRRPIQERDLVLLAGGIEQGQAVTHQGVDVHALQVQGDLAGLHLRQVEHVFDQGQQLLAGGQDPLHLPALGIAQGGAVTEAQQLRKAQDGVQRGAQLVAQA